MKVARTPKDLGPAGWSAVLGAPSPPTPLEGRAVADWLVIGAGFAGLSAARRLVETRPNDRIAVLDAVQVGEGPAGRNSGFMIDLPHDLTSDDYGGDLDADRTQIKANRAAIAFAADAARAYAMPDAAFRATGKVNGAATAKGDAHNASFSRHLAALGEPHERLDAVAMRDLTGGDYYRSGLYSPGTAMIQPALYVRSFAAGLRKDRVALHEQTPVTALDRKGGVWLAETPGGAIEAPRVILAVNGHAESFGQFRGRLMHVFTYASMTRALTAEESARLGGAPDWSLTPADPMGTTVRRVSGPGGDRIIVRNRFTYEPRLVAAPARLDGIARDHDRSFAARFPMLKGVAMEYRWGGRLCLSPNDAPAWGEVEEGVFSACCQNGLGTVRGTFAGVAAADAATGRSTLFAEAYHAAPAPARVPGGPLARLGAPLALRMKERRAGREL